MKFSKSLLNNAEIRHRLFENGIEKSKELLKYVFGIDFNEKGEEIINEKDFTFTLKFNFSDSPITASYKLISEDIIDILKEVIEIYETDENNVKITLEKDEPRITKSDFWDGVKKVQDYLENRYELEFTPLNPTDKDPKIKEIKYDEDNMIWQTTFVQDHQEGHFVATYKDCQNLNIIHYKKHTILLD